MIESHDEFYSNLPTDSRYYGKSIEEICSIITEEQSSIAEIAFNTGARLVNGTFVFSATELGLYTYIVIKATTYSCTGKVDEDA